MQPGLEGEFGETLEDEEFVGVKLPNEMILASLSNNFLSNYQFGQLLYNDK